MTLPEILQDIHAMEEDLIAYERKYGVRSAIFYESYLQGDEPPDGASLFDWVGWAGAYGIWLQRRQQYQEAIQTLQKQTPLTDAA
jgi:hypothetical protein